MTHPIPPLLLAVCALGAPFRQVAAVTIKSAPHIKEGDTIGMAFMGGAFTAGNIGGGIMRGFQQQKVTVDGGERPALEKIDYMAGLSGGNFPVIMYAYAQNVDSDTLLDAGGISDPAQITEEELNTIPEKSMFAPFVESVWEWDRIPRALFSALSPFARADFWTYFVYYQFLDRFGLAKGKPLGGVDSDPEIYTIPRSDVNATPIAMFSMVGPEEAYPDWLYETASMEIVFQMKEKRDLFNTPNLTDIEPLTNEGYARLKEFLKGFGIELPPEDNRLQNSSVMFEIMRDAGYQMPIPFTGTPDEIGSSFHKSTMRFDTNSSEAHIDPIDFEPFYIKPEEAAVEDRTFSVEQLLAFGTALLPIQAKEMEWMRVFPLGAPLLMKVPTSNGSERIMAAADGGYNDATALPTLLQRKVRNIIMVTAHTPNLFSEITYLADPIIFLYLLMVHYFGIWDANSLDADSYVAALAYNNHVFDLFSNGENQLLKLLSDMASLNKAGNPMIATLKNLTTVDNPYYGTTGGETVDLTVIYVFGVPQKFAELVPPEVAPPPAGRNFTEYGFFTNEDLDLVPNVRYNIPRTETILDYNISLPDYALRPKAARMTQILCSWMVKEAWEGLEGADGEMKFGGFREMLGGDELAFGVLDDGNDKQSGSGRRGGMMHLQIISATVVGIVLMVIS